MTIKEITPNNNNIKITVLVSRAVQGIANNNCAYLNLQLQDKTGSINARMWDVSTTDIEQLISGHVAIINANSILYNGELQLKITSYSITNNSDFAADLVIKAPINVNEELTKIKNCVESFSNQTFKQILSFLLNKYETEFIKRPAAVKMHHSVRSGLLWHTSTMLKAAQAIVQIYADREVNAELLYAGVILHDFGKLWELSDEIVTKFTLQGQLMGHIVIGSEQVRIACQSLNIDSLEENVILLQHLILASHGKLEYGSPIVPKTIEAEILHQLDDLDAKITIINDHLKQVKVGEKTTRVIAADNKCFLRHVK